MKHDQTTKQDCHQILILPHPNWCKEMRPFAIQHFITTTYIYTFFMHSSLAQENIWTWGTQGSNNQPCNYWLACELTSCNLNLASYDNGITSNSEKLLTMQRKDSRHIVSIVHKYHWAFSLSRFFRPHRCDSLALKTCYNPTVDAFMSHIPCMCFSQTATTPCPSLHRVTHLTGSCAEVALRFMSHNHSLKVLHTLMGLQCHTAFFFSLLLHLRGISWIWHNCDLDMHNGATDIEHNLKWESSISLLFFFFWKKE